MIPQAETVAKVLPETRRAAAARASAATALASALRIIPPTVHADEIQDREPERAAGEDAHRMMPGMCRTQGGERYWEAVTGKKK